jgi:putative phosphoribosyl transferase
VFNVLKTAVFQDRSEAGRLLGHAVGDLHGLADPIVLALPRGGVPVGHEVAERISAPLDVLVVRKLGTPWQEELALGAVASGGAEFLNRDLVARLRIPPYVIARIREREMAEVERRTREYRGDRPWPAIRGRSVIVVDDGAATGATMLAAIAAVRPQRPSELIVALPVAPPETCGRLNSAADRVVCLLQPAQFFGLGDWYEDFEQVTDEEVRDLLARPARSAAPARAHSG